ncbi:MAG: amidophosphoribosyltransferase [Candidatus Azobacteroides pseudotrichonymphae]|jgi:amidophosphoribosyltransferase|uniref:Amidophosphoribosyltransferase n=1 Tax=Azobacteroides pseudotrichonymphae genomovar. CFP2 TaxID=511995 RepID=B6YQK3_AZOPC|nr:amidophosphoribosyltransferase [Candidatus Azobacteroides pseudotrichonymphae]BAG83475.1 amidophosphoribosyltransferase [Candidatus Azobacteroides pseudotrichonymphae genomovar. CFP2]GMO33007.1 MAG: amidophosphoribosyltransferase [Candidatus Azobacteroides pseudotrichonymphae]
MEYLKHECGIALIRLLKPIEYYVEKYGIWQYGLNKLYLLMEKQHNRGQEGAGIGCINVSAKPGTEYIFRERAIGSNAIKEIFQNAYKAIDKSPSNLPYEEIPFCGELYMGHLRYSTTGHSGISYIHPFLRRNNRRSGSLMLCGNFNLTNLDEVFEDLISKGQHPCLYSDTLMMLEIIGSYLDYQIQVLYEKFKSEKEINKKIADSIDLGCVLRNTVKKWDGGYVVCGATGNIDMFAFRDPQGIRSAFYYKDNEIIIIASERPVIQTVMNLKVEDVQELLPGQAFIVRRNGQVYFEQIQQVSNVRPCSFERIYFSRGSDKDIYQERKMLGKLLLNPILKAIDNDLKNTVFSFIPNTAEIAFYGMMESFDAYLNKQKKQEVKNIHKITDENLDKILSTKIRQEKVAIKDIKLRTFITEGDNRDSLAAHVYDITYGSIHPQKDNLVVIDDSIVRGTTLKQSIINILDRLEPKKIVIVSSSPQVRYPDCYGIDMSRMDEFVAFRAAIALLKERGMHHIIDETYQKCKEQLFLSEKQIVNYVKDIYLPFDYEEIASKITELLRPEGIKAEVIIVYQTLDSLHQACPNHNGDWYFSGNYPTPGGNRFVIRSFIDYYEKKESIQ